MRCPSYPSAVYFLLTTFRKREHHSNGKYLLNLIQLFANHCIQNIVLSVKPSKHFVEIGRVAVVHFGAGAGKPAAIVDVIDQNRALIDGPVTGVKRQAIQFKRLRLTQFRIRIPNGTSSKTVANRWNKDEISKKWKETKQAKRLEANRLVIDFEFYLLLYQI